MNRIAPAAKSREQNSDSGRGWTKQGRTVLLEGEIWEVHGSGVESFGTSGSEKVSAIIGDRLWPLMVTQEREM